MCSHTPHLQAPHDWLFERCCAVVHHGGAGTTACGLYCGERVFVLPGCTQWGRRAGDGLNDTITLNSAIFTRRPWLCTPRHLLTGKLAYCLVVPPSLKPTSCALPPTFFPLASRRCLHLLALALPLCSPPHHHASSHRQADVHRAVLRGSAVLGGGLLPGGGRSCPSGHR